MFWRIPLFSPKTIKVLLNTKAYVNIKAHKCNTIWLYSTLIHTLSYLALISICPAMIDWLMISKLAALNTQNDPKRPKQIVGRWKWGFVANRLWTWAKVRNALACYIWATMIWDRYVYHTYMYIWVGCEANNEMMMSQASDINQTTMRDTDTDMAADKTHTQSRTFEDNAASHHEHASRTSSPDFSGFSLSTLSSVWGLFRILWQGPAMSFV